VNIRLECIFIGVLFELNSIFIKVLFVLVLLLLGHVIELHPFVALTLLFTAHGVGIVELFLENCWLEGATICGSTLLCFSFLLMLFFVLLASLD
jgi:hypothetical protein